MLNRLLILLLSVTCARAAITHLTNVTHVEIQAAITAGSNGDEVWLYETNNHAVTAIDFGSKAMTIRGINGAAIVADLTNRSASLFTASNITNTTVVTRLTGLWFRQGTTNTTGALNAVGAMFNFVSPNELGLMCVDHNIFDNITKSRTGWMQGSLLGYFGYNTVTNAGGAVYYRGVYLNHATVSKRDGHHRWATPVEWGTTNSGIYIEYNTFTFEGALKGRAATDGDAAMQIVFRYNTCNDAVVENHEMGNQYRGPRSFEIYGNTNVWSISSIGSIYVRGGTGPVCSNSITGGSPPALMHLNYNRMTDPFTPYGQANATNQLDTNYTSTFFSGTHTGTNGAAVLSDTNATFGAVNGLIGYTVIHPALGGTDNGKLIVAGTASANTATTITFKSVLFPASFFVPLWTNGQAYSVKLVYQAIDMCGVGTSDLLARNATAGMPPTNTVLGGVTWPRHAFEPIYAWANTGVTNISAQLPHIEGTNYVYDVMPGYTPLGVHPMSQLDNEAGILAFSSATYSVSESGGTATITVTRTVGSAGAVTVDYETSNGTATEGDDYDQATGTLSWMDGESDSKTFDVTITSDLVDENNETVILTLSGETGGATLETAEATLTITDDDSTVVGKGLLNIKRRPRR